MNRAACLHHFFAELIWYILASVIAAKSANKISLFLVTSHHGCSVRPDFAGELPLFGDSLHVQLSSSQFDEMGSAFVTTEGRWQRSGEIFMNFSVYFTLKKLPVDRQGYCSLHGDLDLSLRSLNGLRSDRLVC